VRGMQWMKLHLNTNGGFRHCKNHYVANSDAADFTCGSSDKKHSEEKQILFYPLEFFKYNLFSFQTVFRRLLYFPRDVRLVPHSLKQHFSKQTYTEIL